MTPLSSGKIRKILARMESTTNVRFADIALVCEHYFGPPRQRGSSHMVFSTPWAGDPRVNIQDDHGFAKAYQIRQVLKAIERLEASHD